MSQTTNCHGIPKPQQFQLNILKEEEAAVCENPPRETAGTRLIRGPTSCSSELAEAVEMLFALRLTGSVRVLGLPKVNLNLLAIGGIPLFLLGGTPTVSGSLSGSTVTGVSTNKV